MKAKKRIFSTVLLSSTLTISLAVFLPKPKNQAVMRDWFWFNKTFQQKDLLLIVGGDSRVYRGVSTASINSQLDEPIDAVNLGFSSAGYSQEYLDFLVKHFRENAPQKVLVLGVTPFSFSDEARKNEHLKGYTEQGRLEQWKALYLNPSLNLFEPRKVQDLIGLDSAAYSENYHEDGWMESDEIPGDSLKALRSYEHLFDNEKVTSDAIQIFMESIERLAEQGVLVIGFRPPTTPQMRQLENEKSGFKEREFRLLFEQAGGFWIDFKDEEFATYDGSHLRPTSAKKLSEEIGVFIQSKL